MAVSKAATDHYIVDFICFEARLVIEVDGGQHANSQYDKKRDAHLHAHGFHVLRFWNNDVLTNLDGIHRTIREALARCAPSARPPHPATPKLAGAR
jgi:very-short-patch-repair endonuclease